MVTCHRWLTQSLDHPAHQPTPDDSLGAHSNPLSGNGNAVAAQRQHSAAAARGVGANGRRRAVGGLGCGDPQRVCVCVGGGVQGAPALPSKVILIIDSADLSESVC